MDFSLIETMRWEPATGFLRLDLHLARLMASAKDLGFEGAAEAKSALQDYAEKEFGHGLISPLEGEMSALPTEGGESLRQHVTPLCHFVTSPPQGGRSSAAGEAHRVRLELFPHGKIAITSAPFMLQPENTVWTIKIASARLSSKDNLLRHKTSKRSTYDQARAEFSKEEAHEVLLLNEKVELCEGTITSVFVEGDNGVLLTPPLSSGLLSGVLRTTLICAKKAKVQKLTPNDLRNKTIYVGNSLRGLIEARLQS